MLTYAQLIERLHYDPETGKFKWLVVHKRWANKEFAGTIIYCNGLKYISIRIDGIAYLAHRLAWLYMTGEWPKYNIDHDDGDSLNNKWENLYDRTQSDNLLKANLRCDNTSGHKNVSFDRNRNKWNVCIEILGKRIRKRFDSYEIACSFVDKIRNEHKARKERGDESYNRLQARR